MLFLEEKRYTVRLGEKKTKRRRNDIIFKDGGGKLGTTAGKLIVPVLSQFKRETAKNLSPSSPYLTPGVRIAHSFIKIQKLCCCRKNPM